MIQIKSSDQKFPCSLVQSINQRTWNLVHPALDNDSKNQFNVLLCERKLGINLPESTLGMTLIWFARRRSALGGSKVIHSRVSLVVNIRLTKSRLLVQIPALHSRKRWIVKKQADARALFGNASPEYLWGWWRLSPILYNYKNQWPLWRY